MTTEWTAVDFLPEQRVAVQVWCPENLCQYTGYWDLDGYGMIKWYIFGTARPVPFDVTMWKNLGPSPVD